MSSRRHELTDRLIAVRETGVSRHQGGPIEGPPEIPRTSLYYRIEGIKGVPDLDKWKYSFPSVYFAAYLNRLHLAMCFSSACTMHIFTQRCLYL